MGETNKDIAEQLMREAEGIPSIDRAPRLLAAAQVHALLAVCDALLDATAP